MRQIPINVSRETFIGIFIDKLKYWKTSEAQIIYYMQFRMNKCIIY